MKVQRVNFTKQPILHIHRYVVAIGGVDKKDDCYKTKYHYCANLKEVQGLKKKLTKGQVLEVYQAYHDFREAWYAA